MYVCRSACEGSFLFLNRNFWAMLVKIAAGNFITILPVRIALSHADFRTDRQTSKCWYSQLATLCERTQTSEMKFHINLYIGVNSEIRKHKVCGGAAEFAFAWNSIHCTNTSQSGLRGLTHLANLF